MKPVLSQSDPSPKLRAVVKSDSTDLGVGGEYPRSIYVGGDGAVVAIGANDTDAVTFAGVVAGTTLPISPKRIMAATTATLIIALY